MLVHAHPSWLCISFPQPDLKYFGEQVFVSIRYMILFFGYSLKTTFGIRQSQRDKRASGRAIVQTAVRLRLKLNLVL